MRKLIIAEKPKVAERIARAISQSTARKQMGGVPYYISKENGDEVVVAAAAGHLYGLVEEGEGREYPVFSISWKPLYEADKSKGYTRKYVYALKTLSQGIDEFIVATDWDIEGEILGYNALRFACGKNEAKRMRFSTLVPSELNSAYRNLASLDHALADAGEARHMLDWYWGINVSRALMRAIRSTGKTLILSAGRVQTPALAILAKREKEIASFIAEKFYEIFADIKIKDAEIKAKHIINRLKSREEAQLIAEKSKTKEALVAKAEKKEFNVFPPVPFDLGELQAESYRAFRYSPKKTQDIAQSLYEGGYISYPRTSSQKLPLKIGFKYILQNLAVQKDFKELAEQLLKKERLIPREGKKEDPAHPAIYPTGIIPRELRSEQENVYKLIVFRFLSLFADPALKESIKLAFKLNGEEYLFSCQKIIERGWLNFYPYAESEDISIPEIAEGDVGEVLRVEVKEGTTKPPPRYTPASIIKELERLSLGTKATRAEIVETLYERGYITGTMIRVTELGAAIVEALEKYVPEIINEELTRKFEEELESISLGKLKKEQVLEEAKTQLTVVVTEFQEREGMIGEFLKASLEKMNKKNIIGKCIKCGGELRIIKSKKSGKVFVGCSNYPSCTSSFPLPQTRKVKPTDKLCERCGLPMISISLGRKRMLSCISMECSSKKQAEQKGS